MGERVLVLDYLEVGIDVSDIEQCWAIFVKLFDLFEFVFLLIKEDNYIYFWNQSNIFEYKIIIIIVIDKVIVVQLQYQLIFIGFSFCVRLSILYRDFN